MTKRQPKIEIRSVKTFPITDLGRKVQANSLAKPLSENPSFAEFSDSLPDILKAKDLKEFAGLWRKAQDAKKEIILMTGAHPIKVGLSPIIIDLIDRGFITAIAGNGAVAIHDCEMALFGRTSEEVIEGLADGSFGMAKETGEFLNDAAKIAQREGFGFGETLGDILEAVKPEFGHLSIILACHRQEIPFTTHIAIGTDIVHQHPNCDGSAIGEASYTDFKIFSHKVSQLSEGIVINLGSAVIMPEVFLKALTVARNLGNKVENFTSANFDQIQHYRPNTNVLDRPTITGGGKKFAFTGHHEIMLPLVAGMVKGIKDKG
jgi:hypothetical protein